ncbi:MAG: hypothetical protein WBB70_03175 [Desulfobacterales bacterium]
MGKKIVYKPNNLFHQINLFDNSPFKIFRGFHRSGLRQFQVGDVEAFSFEAELPVLGAGFIGQVYFGNNGPLFQGQQAFFKVGILAFNGNGLFGVVMRVSNASLADFRLEKNHKEDF